MSESGSARQVHQYVADVLGGRILASEYVGQACERYQRDQVEASSRGLRFDVRRANHALRFFRFLRHWKGEWAGQEFHLQAWQQFIIWNLFGWTWAASGLRRYRTAYISVARKNGKSTFAAGVGLYCFWADGEPGAEVYTAATKRDQARIVHRDAIQMVKAGPLASRIRVYRDNLSFQRMASKYVPLGADSGTHDGLNPHCVLLDELHAHKDRGMYDVLDTAMGARREPLLFVITTAGSNRQSICGELQSYSEKVLSGVLTDETWFAYVAQLDADDDWSDESLWLKANPNIGISVKLDDLRRQRDKAQETPAAQNAFRRLRCNQWTQAETRWIDMQRWDACNAAPEIQPGMACYAGLDLATTTDICALVLVFPTKDGLFHVQPHFWVPGERILKRVRRDRVPYDAWGRDGLINVTDGDVVDYDVIREHIKLLGKRYDIREIPTDPWNSTQLATQLEGDGFTVVQFRQGFASMSGPSKETETLILGKKLRHGGHPVLRWMADNVMVKMDPAGNIKPDKSKSHERIDGIVALIMAVGRAISNINAGRSVYDEREVRWV